MSEPSHLALLQHLAYLSDAVTFPGKGRWPIGFPEARKRCGVEALEVELLTHKPTSVVVELEQRLGHINASLEVLDVVQDT